MPSQSKISSGCYIATCIYGSYDCPQVWTLRRFRDDNLNLNKSFIGKCFIKCYYAISPKLVKYFGRTKLFRAIWKTFLDRVVQKLNKKGIENTNYKKEKLIMKKFLYGITSILVCGAIFTGCGNIADSISKTVDRMSLPDEQYFTDTDKSLPTGYTCDTFEEFFNGGYLQAVSSVSAIDAYYSRAYSFITNVSSLDNFYIDYNIQDDNFADAIMGKSRYHRSSVDSCTVIYNSFPGTYYGVYDDIKYVLEIPESDETASLLALGFTQHPFINLRTEKMQELVTSNNDAGACLVEIGEYTLRFEYFSNNRYSFLFDGKDLVAMISGTGEIATINTYSTEIPDSLFDIPSDYTIINSDDAKKMGIY